MKIIAVRHGETAVNIAKGTHHTGDEASLTEQGREQIRLAAEAIARYHAAQIYASPEIRTQESAAIIHAVLHCPMHTEEALRERNWGAWEGRPWQEIADILTPLDLETRFTFTPPGGESWEQMENRLKEFIDQIAVDTVLVTHGGVLRAMVPLLLRAPRETSFEYDFANASVSVFSRTNGRFEATELNDTSHLK